MKKSDATPNTRVIAAYHYDSYEDTVVGPYNYDADNVLIGVICDKNANPGKVWVQWIEGDFDEDEQEVDLKILSLESDRSQLDEDFKKLEKEIKGKMKAAAELVNEAGKLAKKANVRYLEEMYDAVTPLINAMDNNGWRSSSWGC